MKQITREQIEQIQPQTFSTSPKNVYIADGVHRQVAAIIPGGNRLAVGEKTNVEFQTPEGRPLQDLTREASNENLTPRLEVTKGEERVRIDESGNIEALQPGEVTLQAKVPGLAANRGFLFIKALGRVGAVGDNGEIHWDIAGMILFFGVSLYVNQLLSGQGSSDNPQQSTVNKLTPVLFSGMFFFFPLPAGVLMYMVLANIFQTIQTFILSREPLPENLQKLVEAEGPSTSAKSSSNGDGDRKSLPFEPGQRSGKSNKKNEKSNKSSKKKEKA